jgi:hypothetical protein
MIHSQNQKVVSLFKPQSVATNATASGTQSVTGWDYAEVVVHLDTAAATSTDATLEVSLGDGTTFVTESSLAMTTAAPDTSNQQFYRWFIDLKARKKNIKLAYTPSGAARIASAHLRLSRGEVAPDSASELGAAGIVRA